LPSLAPFFDTELALANDLPITQRNRQSGKTCAKIPCYAMFAGGMKNSSSGTKSEGNFAA
jgi:hypothetical protein